MSEAEGKAQRTQVLAGDFWGKELMEPSGIA
jgi:hypothetical protein